MTMKGLWKMSAVAPTLGLVASEHDSGSSGNGRLRARRKAAQKIIGIAAFALLVLIGNEKAFSQSLTLDAALLKASEVITTKVPGGTKVAVINIDSGYADLSEYIINELIAHLVGANALQVVPRRTVELEAARGELDFQMSGYVDDDAQKRLGRFLGAGTIITGTVTRDSGNSFRLSINAIDVESFTYQATYRDSIQNNAQVKALIAGSGGELYEDYTIGERLGTGALNIFFGIGSIMKKQRLGWITTAAEIVGIALLATGVSLNDSAERNAKNNWSLNGRGEKEYDPVTKYGDPYIAPGIALIVGGVVFGFIVPFLYHKPNNTNVSANNNFPIDIGLVPTDNTGAINGVRVLYKLKF